MLGWEDISLKPMMYIPTIQKNEWVNLKMNAGTRRTTLTPIKNTNHEYFEMLGGMQFYTKVFQCPKVQIVLQNFLVRNTAHKYHLVTNVFSRHNKHQTMENK